MVPNAASILVKPGVMPERKQCLRWNPTVQQFRGVEGSVAADSAFLLECQ